MSHTVSKRSVGLTTHRETKEDRAKDAEFEAYYGLKPGTCWGVARDRDASQMLVVRIATLALFLRATMRSGLFLRATMRSGQTKGKGWRYEATPDDMALLAQSSPEEIDLVAVRNALSLSHNNAPTLIPVSYRIGGLVLETIEQIESEKVREFLGRIWDGLPQDRRELIAGHFELRVMKALQGSGPFEARVREQILSFVADLAEQEVAKRAAAIRAQVEAEVEKRWTDVVEQVVQRKLDAALSKIKAEMARG